MERGEGQAKKIDPQVADVQRAQEALDREAIRASQGDARAAARLLTELAGGDRRAQTQAASALLKAAEASLWDHLLEFACLGTWAGQEVSLPTPAVRRLLRLKLEALFLSQQDGPSATVRQEVLVRGLASPEARMRRFAIGLLGQWESIIDPGALAPLLKDADVGVRLGAARTLGRMGDARSLPALIEALGHSDDLIAGEAAAALALMGRAALEPLIKALGNDDPHLRWHAAKALAQTFDPRAINALISALDDQNFGVRWFAANGLAALGSQALAPLLRALRTKETTPWLAEAAIHILKNIKEADLVILVEELEKRLRDPYANVEVPLEADRLLRKLEGGKAG